MDIRVEAINRIASLAVRDSEGNRFFNYQERWNGETALDIIDSLTVADWVLIAQIVAESLAE